MVIRGRVPNGVIVLGDDASLPEGTEVTIEVGDAQKAAGKRMSQEEHRRVLEIMDRIAAMPIEGTSEPFSGADHDKVLYGKP